MGALLFRTIDYADQPPAQVFAMVLNQPVPQGVSALRVSGRGFGQGHEVWMRFHATNAAIKALLSTPKLEVQEPEAELQWTMPRQVLEDEKARAVGWEEVLQLRKIESHQFRFANSNGGWVGEIVVDRDKNVVYVNAGLL